MKNDINFVKSDQARGWKAACAELDSELQQLGVQGQRILFIDAWMERGSGYGRYINKVQVLLNSHDTVTAHKSHTDSTLWDERESTPKFHLRIFRLMVKDLAEGIAELIDTPSI